MAKSQPEPTPQPGSESQQDDTLNDRVSSLETGQETLSGKIDHLIDIVSGHGGARGQGEGHDRNPTGDGPSVAHEIRAQLDERDRKKAEADAAAARDGEVTALKEQVAALTETTPAPPPRRIERFMGWH